MPPIDLQVRDLDTGDRSIASFPSEEEAITWLNDRPRFQEVMGVAMTGLAHEIDARLRAALRPLDDEEREKAQALETKALEDAQKRAEEAQKREQATAEAHRAALASAPPDRPMEIRYRYDRDLELVDVNDTRPITPEAREAVLAWVAEREEWVRGRGQTVGEARVTVYPAGIPAQARGERVRTGSFVPITASAKPAST
ncbi:hypothetical protein [Chondromyces crocatus]|uniref:Uncharacterized protein n=1 Tax=Chondromyces crocatus TaxID=52 RepID=A0A0K1EDG3_CHOCO|nr:hypothetical protein [Chondromyces crocatus]AKT38727.1 uncharacterized protein CMC5_028710 [Chondromyces crocatus]